MTLFFQMSELRNHLPQIDMNIDPDNQMFLPVFHTGWWFGTFFIFPYIGNVIIPTDELTFFRGVGQPPTRLTEGSIL